MSTPAEEPNPVPQPVDLDRLCTDIIATVDRLFELLDGIEYGDETDY